MKGIGIIGLGFMGATHVKAWQQVPGARIAALCNPSGRRLDGDFSDVGGNVGDGAPLKLDMSGVAAHRSFQAMLEDPAVDAIDICTPTHTHHELALAAIRAGKHVLCEKPMARTSSEAREIVDAANEAGLLLVPAMCLRFWPEWAWLKEAVAGSRFGRVLSARFTRIAEPPAWGQETFFDGAKSGGGLLDLHIHDTDFVHHLFGMPRVVQSWGYSRVSDCIDHVVTHYEVEGGALVIAEGAWTMARGFGFRMAYTVNFEEATADYDLARGAEALKLSASGETCVVKCDGPDGYVGQLRHFVDRMNGSIIEPVVTAADGLTAVMICEAEEESALSGRPVPPGA